MMNFEELRKSINQWAIERDIYEHSTTTAQLLKAVSEMGELADAEAKDDLAACIDGVGDVIVCLINYCAIKGIDIVGCLECSYGVIKDRKGRMMPGGVFIKEAQ